MELRNLGPDELGRLALLADIGAMFNRSYDVEEVLARVIDVVIETLAAERGFIMLEQGGDEVEIAVSCGIQPEVYDHEQFRYSRTIVERVLQSGAPVLSNDAQNDERFVGSKSLTALRTRSIMCVPLRTLERSLGLIYLDHQNQVDLFGPTDLDLLKIIADMAAAAIERARYFHRLMQREKMSALGRLVAGVVHELNSPLTSIIGFAQLQTLHEHDAECRENAEFILAEGERCKKLIADLLGLSREKKTTFRELDVQAVVARAMRLLARDMNEDRVSVSTDIVGPLPDMRGDPDQVLQLLLNLLDNARRAVRGREKPTVEIRVAPLEEGVVLRVSDNGPGIAPAHLGRIFDPFFTTREAGEGTGLGLSIVARIVTDHGGTIRAQNRKAGGACFIVELPARPSGSLG
jgi:signal transduction histidine kinase